MPYTFILSLNHANSAFQSAVSFTMFFHPILVLGEDNWVHLLSYQKVVDLSTRRQRVLLIRSRSAWIGEGDVFTPADVCLLMLRDSSLSPDSDIMAGDTSEYLSIC